MSLALRVRPHVESDPDGTFDSRYYTKAQVDSLLASISSATHNHDDRYYTEAEVDALLAGKSGTSHTHDDRYYTEGEVDSALALRALATHSHDDRYFTESEVTAYLSGKANTSHTHSFASLTGKPDTFVSQDENPSNTSLAVGGPYTLNSVTIGPLVNGQKYLVLGIGEVSFDGADGIAADMTLQLQIAGNNHNAIDTSRAEGGVDVGYTIVKPVHHIGTGGTIAINHRGTVNSGGVNMRYARLSVIAFPVNS